MALRVVSGLIGIGLWIAITFAGPIPFTFGVTVLTIAGVWEIVSEFGNSLAMKRATPSSELPGWSGGGGIGNSLVALSGVVLPVAAWWISTRTPAVAVAVANVLAVLAAVYSLLVLRFNRAGHVLGSLRAAYGLLGPLYVGALFSGAELLRTVPGQVVVAPFGEADLGAWLVVFVAACTWMTDTFAFLFGKRFGKHPLAPRLSPHKTVEGSLGGILGAALIGAIWGAWIHLPLVHGTAVGLIAGTVGQMGDLFESALKREIGVKDFGRIMPGHGGVLDRFDSLLFVTPVAYLYLRVVAGVG